MKKAATKIRMPTRANTSALTMLGNVTIGISFSSCVMMIASVDGTIWAGIVPNGPRHVLDFVDRCEAPAADGAGSDKQYHHDSVNQIKPVPDHSSPPIDFMGWSLSAQRICSKL